MAELFAFDDFTINSKTASNLPKELNKITSQTRSLTPTFFQAKVNQDTPLPSWLMFDKSGGVFWGVPTTEDVGILHISVKAVRQSATVTDEFNLIISDDTSAPEGTDKCPSTEDSTVLTLMLDKSVKAIKPKQRVIAINNVAKFFGMPYVSRPTYPSAFLIV